MSVLIKGMKMPDSCYHCKISGSCQHYEEKYSNKRHEDCPLVELPEKHKRLIDANELRAKMLADADTYSNDDIKHGYHNCELLVDDAPTIEPEQKPNNKVNLCDSCTYTFPDCPSKESDMIFGNGIGDDNICACAKYVPLERKMGKWLKPKGHDDARCCSECKYICHEDYAQFYIYCPNCGADMRGEQNEDQ